MTLWDYCGVFLMSLLGNLVAWKWVFKTWRFPKIIYVPVSRDNENLKHIQRSMELQDKILKKRKGLIPPPPPPEGGDLKKSF